MKKYFTLVLLIVSLQTFSQIYPYGEGFEGLPSNQVPPGWEGNMLVWLDHGINDSKAIAARVSSAVTVDSAITPLIGPLTSSSTLSFEYRIIDQANYPSTPTNLDSNSEVRILLSTDSVNYQTVFLINMDNHNPSFNFVRKKVYITQHVGSNVYLKFRCQYGTGTSFFVDIDTVAVTNDPHSGIEEVNNDWQFSVYPNPCNQLSGLQFWVVDELIGKEMSISDIAGREIEKTKINSSAFHLPSSNLEPGIYFAAVNDERKTITRKLILGW